MRPLWLLGMILYMFVSYLLSFICDLIPSSLSQLIGSTLALGYMRAGVFRDIFTLRRTERNFL
jgi:hypothetical protein